MVAELHVVESARPVLGPACMGCGHVEHAAYGCRASAIIVRGRCGCDSNWNDLPAKWRGPDDAA